MAIRSALPSSPAAPAVVLLSAGAGYVFAGAAPGLTPVAAVLLVVGGLSAVFGVVRGRAAPAVPDEDDPRDAAPTVLWRLRTSVPDTPGRLARVAGGLAEIGGNIRTVHVHPTRAGAVDEVLLHAPPEVTAATVRRAVRAAGGSSVTAVRADVHELDDVPTRAFALATRLVDGSSDLSRALRGVLGEIEVGWDDRDEDEELVGVAMRLRTPGGGTLRLRRHPEFTPAEFARARAMAQLAATCRARVRDEGDQVRVAGEQFTVLRADREDLAAVSRFHENCSRAARSERYFASPSGGHQRELLRRLLAPPLGRTLLLREPGGEVVAMGNLMYDGPDAELGLLVRDDWQRRGLGTFLARRLVAEAGAVGVGEVRAQTLVHNTAIARTLRSAGLRLTGVAEPGEWTWSRRTGEPAPQPLRQR